MRVEGSFDVAKRLLLVDDEPAIIKGLKFSLEQDGYEILTASYARAVRFWLPRVPLPHC